MQRGTIGIPLAFLLAFAAKAQAGEIRATYAFGITDQGAWGADLATARRELHPVVPARVARFLLQPGQKLADVRFTPGEIRRIPFRAEVAAKQVPLSLGYDVRPDGPAWDGGAYPADWTDAPQVREDHGYDVVEVRLNPLRVMGDGTAAYVTSGELTVTTEEAFAESPMLRHRTRDLMAAMAGADNSYALVLDGAKESEGYLIIGPQALIGTDESTSALEPLIADKRERGLTVKMATLESVSPSKDPAQIRAYIKQQYQQAGIDYVLLVGDHQRLPWKKLRAGTGDSSEPVPSDQYYACLDGTFDNVQSYDWACEVAVGRVGVQDAAQLGAWVQKTLALQAATREGRTTAALSYGEKLDGSTLGGWSLDKLVTGSQSAPVTTGFPGSTNFSKLYDTFQREQPSSEFVRTLNAGDFQVVNHLGHANETYVFRMNASDQAQLRSRPAFFYTQGCYPNDPDKDNWTIRAVRMPSYGPAAMIANTRYGWYEPGQNGEGSSNKLHRTFWSMRFADGLQQIGKMNVKAKQTLVAVDSDSITIYTALESSLIGDPELDLGIR